VILALFLTMTCAGCASSAGSVARSLPGPPEYLRPVPVPPVRPGQDARSALARSSAALGDANGRIVAGREAWVDLQRSYAGAQ
jgi:hypothetical protein